MIPLRSLGLAAALLASLAQGSLIQAAAAADKPVVAITAIVEHPSLNAIREGVKAGLKDKGYAEGEAITVLYESAQGNPATAAQIAQKFVGEAPAVIVPITTPSSQAVAAATKDIPVVFAAVTDPLGAQLIKALDKPGGNITGVSDFPPAAGQLDLIKEVLPKAKVVGVVYNSGEVNSLSVIEALRKLAGERGFEILPSPATKSSDVGSAAQNLVGKADAIYIPNDNLVVSALESVLQVGFDSRLPVFASDPDSVGRGAVAALGLDQFEIGRQAGHVAARILKGEKPGDIPVENSKGVSLVVNSKAAEKMGAPLPQAVLARAKDVAK
ncbi:ABC transporter substrate-binding protein [Labrys neptuniae]|uniref:ABC transporter substrate-binding protein n=1 Tax=Labrys TaxID=204476 RepID=UPI0028914A50|nr:ABC transporter substrate-binding protein [Labrys neptuniae]MDT3378857.1 ABC transporter substrate-binding protein [Labrys neptuniae]